MIGDADHDASESLPVAVHTPSLPVALWPGVCQEFRCSWSADFKDILLIRGALNESLCPGSQSL